MKKNTKNTMNKRERNLRETKGNLREMREMKRTNTEGKGNQRTRVKVHRHRSVNHGSSDESRKVHSGNAFEFIKQIGRRKKSFVGPIKIFLFILFTTLRRSRKVNSETRVLHALTQLLGCRHFKWAWAIGIGLGFKVGWAEENFGPIICGLTLMGLKTTIHNKFFFIFIFFFFFKTMARHYSHGLKAQRYLHGLKAQ